MCRYDGSNNPTIWHKWQLEISWFYIWLLVLESWLIPWKLNGVFYVSFAFIARADGDKYADQQQVF
jgi:hypothetical protein